ncbi:MAG: hypothetical protein KGI58_03035 [Patescibacteria group bacterium]|nr:hypothetical protein [Patescibacteria group bacterium]
MKILKNKLHHKLILKIAFYFFAIVGFIFTSVFIAMSLHLTNVAGSIDARNASFNIANKNFTHNNIVTSLYSSDNSPMEVLDPVTECRILTISSILPENGKVIMDTYISTKSSIIAQKMIRAVELVTTNNTFLQNRLSKCDIFSDNNSNSVTTASNQTIFGWILSKDWEVMRAALIKDKDIILQASRDSGIPARIIVSTIIPEQFRFFTSNREDFKKYLEPLKVLGNLTKFSYGIAGVKINTAETIENNLKDTSSPYYLGPSYEHIFDYSTTDINSERLQRLTDTNNHYYSYLYTAIFLKEIMHQWQLAGYPISDRPEVLATLFNIGFNKSVPKANPEVGGSTITINDRDYTFGDLAYEFYYSGELSDIFPIKVE